MLIIQLQDLYKVILSLVNNFPHCFMLIVAHSEFHNKQLQKNHLYIAAAAK